MHTYRVGAFATKVGVHKNTVKEWDRDCGRAPRSAPQRVAVHGRVSRRAQHPGLEAQRQAMETFCLGAGITVDDGLTAIGGGLPCQRPVLRALMACIACRERFRVAHKDRPCRCGFDGCEDCAETHDCAIRVVHRESLSPPAELVEDPMAVVHTFSGRRYGLRRHGKQIREAAPDG